MDINTFFKIWSSIYLFDLLRYLIPASIAFVVFYWFGRNRWKHLIIQGHLPEAKQMWSEFKYSMSTVLIFSLVGFGIFTSEHAGWTQIYHNVDDYSGWYFVFSIAVMILFHDFYFYWTHRLMHHKAIFRHVHLVHHQSTNPSPWAAYSFHPIEAVVQASVFPIMVFTVPAHPIALTVFLLYMIVRNVLGHVGFEIYPKGFIASKWLNWNTSTTHHSMHHKFFDCNYGLYFSWWDDLLRTTHAKYKETFEEIKARPRTCELKRKQNKSVATLIVLFISCFSLAAQSVSGKWVTYNEQTGSALSVIEIKQANNSIEGRIEQLFLEPYQGDDPVCTKCTDERRGNKVIDMNFMWGFKQGGSVWTSGKILDPASGEVYVSKLWLEDRNTLQVRGYAGPLDLFHRTQTWKREGASYDKTPVGIWQTIDDQWNKVKSIVEIKNENGELKGYVRRIYLMPHEGTDPVCIECKGSLKNSKIVGMRILSDFRNENGKWVDGSILDPGNGNTYTSSIWLLDADTLNVRGYLGPFYRSQIWKRLKS